MAEETLHREVQSNAQGKKQPWLHTQNSTLWTDEYLWGVTPGDSDSSALNSTLRKPKSKFPMKNYD